MSSNSPASPNRMPRPTLPVWKIVAWCAKSGTGSSSITRSLTSMSPACSSWPRRSSRRSGILCIDVRAMEDTQVSSVGKAQIQLKVDEVCCADEVAQVEDALKKLDSVREVQASIVAGMVTIVYDPSVRDFAPPDTSSIRTAVEGVGCSIPLSVENPP